jgi:fucose permease
MTASFTRTRLTWLLYFSMVMFGYCLNGLGPVTPFLKDELQLSYTVSSLHFSAFALGMILSGLGGHRVIQRLGRQRVLWAGFLGLALGAVGMALGRTPFVTIASAFVMGGLGSLLLSIVSSALSDQYGPQRAVALAEANVMAALGSIVPPLLVGWFAQTVLGWRVALWFAAAVALTLRLSLGKVSIPEEKPEQQTDPNGQRLPLLFWAYWAGVVLAIAIEFCLVSWSVDFVEKSLGLARADATQAFSLFLVGMITGRLAASRLVQRLPVNAVILGSLLVTALGFGLYWTGATAWVGLAGLLLCGLGIAPLNPLAVSLAMGAANGNTNAASVRTSLATGLAIFSLPLTLGRLADTVGIHSAYILVPLLILVMAGLILAAGRWGRLSVARS